MALKPDSDSFSGLVLEQPWVGGKDHYQQKSRLLGLQALFCKANLKASQLFAKPALRKSPACSLLPTCMGALPCSLASLLLGSAEAHGQLSINCSR